MEALDFTMHNPVSNIPSRFFYSSQDIISSEMKKIISPCFFPEVKTDVSIMEKNGECRKWELKQVCI